MAQWDWSAVRAKQDLVASARSVAAASAGWTARIDTGESASTRCRRGLIIPAASPHLAFIVKLTLV